MEELGARRPCLVGRGSSSPPPLFLPREARAKRFSSGTGKKVEGPWDGISGPASTILGAREETLRRITPTSTAACERKETVRDPLTIPVRLKVKRCNGAPLAEEGKMRAGTKSWCKFSRTRLSQDSSNECSEDKGCGLLIGGPPRMPPDLAEHRVEASGECGLRVGKAWIGCPWTTVF